MIEAYTTYERGWIMRIRPASQTPPSKVILLVHGWTGDERSMEVFTRGLPPDFLLLYPRGPVQAPAGGYGWVDRAEGGGLTHFLDLIPVCQRLITDIDQRLAELGLNHPPLRVAGFSQGAAVTYALTLLYPERIERAAALAGFLPTLPLPFAPQDLQGIRFFVAHGTEDETIPVDKAREAVEFLRSHQAQVEYCESSTGHKLALNCYSRLNKFLGTSSSTALG